MRLAERRRLLIGALLACFFLPLPIETGASDPPPAGILERRRAADIVALRSITDRYLVLRGRDEGQTVTVSLQPADGRSWELAIGNRYRLHLSLAVDGALVLERIENLERDRTILLSPAIKIVPADVVAGRQERSSGAVRVRVRTSGRDLYGGSYAFELKGVRRSEFDTPAGDITGVLLEHEADLQFPLTRVHLDLETGWSPDRRVVYVRIKSTRETVGIFGQTAVYEMVIAGS
jgi:hypothetical protein